MILFFDILRALQLHTQLAPEFLALKPQPGECGWTTSLVFSSGQQHWASSSCFQIKITSHLPVMTKFSRNEFHLNRWFKMKVWHWKCQGMTQGYTTVNLKTSETEVMPAALLPRQQWPNSFSSPMYRLCWKVAWGSFSHSLPSSAPWWKPVPKQPCCSHPHLSGGGRNANRTFALMRTGASLPRREREYQIQWETFQFLKVTEIMSRWDALFLICWYMIYN